MTTSARGVRVSEPLVGIDVSDPQAIQTGQLERLARVHHRQFTSAQPAGP